LTRPYDSILFDFDGVLADTEPIHWACWAETLAPLDIELSWETYRANCIGVADRNMLVFLASLATRAVEPESLRPQYAVKKALFQRRIQDANPCPAGTVELIRAGGARLILRLGGAKAKELLPVVQAFLRGGA